MKRLAILVLVAVIALALGTAPAAAVTTDFGDRDGGTGTAITGITVQNGARILIVSIDHRKRLAQDTVWIDTRKGDRGPEYRVQFLANSDYISLRRVETFAAGGKRWFCNRAVVRSDNYEPGATSWIKVPHGCLSGPGRVRVEAESMNSHGKIDAAPNRGTYWPAGWFTPWVRRG